MDAERESLVAGLFESTKQADAAFCLVLEDIQDPGNVGALLRSAAAAGVKDVLMSRTCASRRSPTSWT